jgi:glycolate oxidase iron-sulfur subunit
MMSAALLRGALQPDATLQRHLSHCLHCRACEKACPSEVPYGALIDAAQTLLPPPRGRTALLLWLSRKPKLIQLLAVASRWWHRLRLPAPTIAQAAAALLPTAPSSLRSHYPASGEQIGRVGLFPGCVAGPFDQQTHQSAITLLNRLGYEVVVPQQQQCCGALAQHHGRRQQATAHASHNRALFAQQAPDAILFSSSGCGAQLVEQGGAELPYREICDFILQSPRLDTLHFQPLPQRVSLHHPCSLRNVLRGSEAVEQLLQRIPSLDWSELGPNPNCCGAAGSHQIREPALAATLRQPKLEALQQSAAKLLLTTNYGCALHLAEGVLQQQQRVELLHPITLLARQLSPH